MSGFDKLCRACLSIIDNLQYNLFENVSPDIYWFCTNIEVVKDENLPKSICNKCYDQITKFSEFKRTCLQSQNTLLNSFSVLPEGIKLDWLNNDPRVVDNSLNKFVEKYEDVIIKEENFSAHYDDDFDTADNGDNLLEVKKTKTHKKVRVKAKRAKGKKLKQCELCSKTFASTERLKLHNLAHQQKLKSLKCTPCNKTFLTLSGLKRHRVSWHMRIRLSSVTCRICGKIAKSRDSLRAHEKLHGDRKLFICNVCGKGCTTSSILKAHLETHKENRERQYTCEHCGKKFYTSKILVSHVQRCHTGKRYICQICNYPFTDKYNLAKHLLNHDGKGSSFKCEVCNKSYTSRSSYVEHQRTHSGERPYVCTYCSKSFVSKKRLTEHHRTHTGEKPHKCLVCEHSFAQRGTLTRHMKVHERVVPVIN